ncbi:MAG: hypothetical protein ACI4QO_07250, partial [Clostridia bacterium]
MQAELSDKINENETLRQIARTALVVVLVCAAMPFLKIVTGETAVSFSLWQFATSAFRYSDIGHLLPESLSSMLMVSRIMAWAVMICGGLGLILL